MANDRILIVEDDAIISAHLRSVLTDNGYRPAAVSSGEEAINKAVEMQPALVLMDIRLAGEMDGVEAAKQIRERVDVPVAYLTAYASDALLQRAKTTQPYSYLVKPIQERELVATIEMALYTHEMSQRLRESEEKNRAVLAALPDITFIQSRDGTFVDCHVSSEADAYGSLEQILGKNVADVLPEEVSASAIECIERVLQTGEIQSFEYQAALGGEIRHWESRFVPCGEETVLSVVRDITDLKQAQQKLKRQLKELTILHSAALAGAEAADENTLIEQASQVIGEMLNAQTFGVMLLDEASQVLRTHASYRGNTQPLHIAVPAGEGLIGQVAADGIPRRILVSGPQRKETNHLLVTETGEKPPLTYRSELCVPLRAENGVIGVIHAASVEPDAFVEEDERFLTTFASHLTTAIQKVRLMNALHQRVLDRTEELSLLYDVTALANEPLDLKTTLEKVLRRILASMRAHQGAIHLLDKTAQTLHLAAQRGVSPEAAAQVREITVGAGLIGWVMGRGEQLVVPNLALDPRASGIAWPVGEHAYIGVPVHIRGQAKGVLSLIGEKGAAPNEEEATLACSIADYVGVLVENSLLREQAELATIMEERRRVARELHDSVTQSLYSINLLAEGGRRFHQAGRLEKLDDYLAELVECAQTALREMRLMVYELRSPALEQEGLANALERRLAAVERRAHVKARLLVEGEIRLSPQHEQGLYRIALEALNNSLKHAAATRVVVRIRGDRRSLELEVEDDGVGFDLNGKDCAGGMGLAGMRERAERMGGALKVVSAPGEGTRVSIRVETRRNL